MLQRLRALRRNESGFTLTELLIVIVILGILTGVVIIAVGAFQDRGESAACRADKKTVEIAVEAYRAKNTGYPASLDVLVADEFLRSLPNANPTKYTITYYLTGRAAGGGLPALAAGGVEGRLGPPTRPGAIC